MGCANSSDVGSMPPQQRNGQGAAAYTPHAAHGDGTQMESPTSPGSSGGVTVTADELARGGLMVLSQLSRLSGGQFDGVVEVLQSLYMLWNSAATKAIWAAEFYEYIQLVEADLRAADRPATRQAFYLRRIESLLLQARSTLQEVMSPARSFVVDIVRLPFLQSQLAQIQSQLSAVRQEALAGTLVDAALDVRQTAAIVDALLSGQTGLPVDARGAPLSIGTAGQGGGASSSSALLSTGPASPSPLLAKLFSSIGAVMQGYAALESALERRNQKKRKNGGASPTKSSSDDEPLRPPVWLSEFVLFLRQVRDELTQATLLLSSGAANTLAGGRYLSELESSLHHAQRVFQSVAARHGPPSATLSVSSFLRLLAAPSDQGQLRDAKGRVDAAKAKMLGAILTQMQEESSALSTGEGGALAALEKHIAAQQGALEQAASAARRRAADEMLLRALAPVDCAAELQWEHRRFLRGTRASVLRLFRAWIGDDAHERTDPRGEVDSTAAAAESAAAGASASASASSLYSSPLFLILSSPGHGKTTLASFLAETHAHRVAAAHFFKFDMLSRRGAGRAVRSIAWQIAERVPGVKEGVVQALLANGVDVEGVGAASGPDASAGEGGDGASGSGSGGGDPASNPSAATSMSMDGLDRLGVLDLWEQLVVRPLWKVDAARKEAAAAAEAAQVAAAAAAVAESGSDSSSTASANASPAPAAPSTPSKYFILLDALDESESGGNNALLKLLSAMATPGGGSGGRFGLPAWLGVVVSARPEGHILRALAKALAPGRAVANLDELDGGEEGASGTKMAMKKKTTLPPISAPASSSATEAAASSVLPGATALPAQSDLSFFFEAVLATFMPLPDRDSGDDVSQAQARTAALQERSRCVAALVRKSRGMFLYARLILEQHGLDLSLVGRDDEGEEGQSRVEPVRLTQADIDSFPAGLNNFYLELFTRASAPPLLPSGKKGPSPWVALRHVLAGAVVAMEPLSLHQVSHLAGFQGWEDAVRRCEGVRSVVHVKPRPGGSSSSSSTALGPSSVVQIFHRSVRDWLVSPERKQDPQEAVFHIDEVEAASNLLRRGWAEMLEQGPAQGSPAAAASAVQDSPSFAPLLRVGDAVLPSRLRASPHFLSSLLHYSIAHLPSHALQLVQAEAPVLVRAPAPAAAAAAASTSAHVASDSPTSSLHILLSLLCNLHYVHMRSYSDAAARIVQRQLQGKAQAQAQGDSAEAEAAVQSHPTVAASASACASALVKEYALALALLERMAQQRKSVLAARAAEEAQSAAAKLASAASAPESGSESGSADPPGDGAPSPAPAPAKARPPPDAVLSRLRRGISQLRAFQRFYRSEFPHLLPLSSKVSGAAAGAELDVGLELANYASTLTAPYQYAQSYPQDHPVRAQALSGQAGAGAAGTGAEEASPGMGMGAWIRAWKTRCATEAESLASDAASRATALARSSAPGGAVVFNDEHPIPRESLLPRGWVSWTNAPEHLSPCVAVIPAGGPVSSLACAARPQAMAPSAAAAASSSLSEEAEDPIAAVGLTALVPPPSVLVAVAQSGGTFDLLELETFSRVRRSLHGRSVAFDTRPPPPPPPGAGEGEEGEEAEAEAPFAVVACNPAEWLTLDLSPLASGKDRSQNINWTAATTQLRQMAAARAGPTSPPGGRPGFARPPFPSPPRIFHHGALAPLVAVAPLRDRALLVQYNTADVAYETLLHNRGSTTPFPAGELDPSRRVVAVAFSPDGLELFLAQEGAPGVLVFSCGERDSGRAGPRKFLLHPGHGGAHATALSYSSSSSSSSFSSSSSSSPGGGDMLARGGADGSVGFWRRVRTRVTRGDWVGEDSRWDYVSLHQAPFWKTGAGRFLRGGAVAAVAVSNDGGRILASIGSTVLLYTTSTAPRGGSSGAVLAHYMGHLDLVRAVSFSPEPQGRYALSGGGGVDESVRVWELPVEDEDDDEAEGDAGTEAEAGETETSAVASPVSPSSPSGGSDQAKYTLYKRSVRSLFFHTRGVLLWNGNRGIQSARPASVHGVGAGAAAAQQPPEATIDGCIAQVRPDTLVRVVAPSPHDDGDTLLCGSSCDDLELWSFRRGALVRPLLQTGPALLGREDLVPSASPPPSSVSVTKATGEVLSERDVTAARFTPCGRFVLAAGFDRRWRVWHAASGQLVCVVELFGLDETNEHGEKPSAPQIFDIDLLKVESADPDAAGAVDEYLVAAVAPADRVNLWRMRALRSEAAGADPAEAAAAVPPAVSVERVWQVRVCAEAGRDSVRGVLLYQPLPAPSSGSDGGARLSRPEPLLLTCDSASAVQVRAVTTGKVLYAFSTAPDGKRVDQAWSGDALMQIVIVDAAGVHAGSGSSVHGSGSAVAAVAASAPSSSASADSGSVQLFALNAYSGLSVWQLGPVLRELAAGRTPGEVWHEPSSRARAGAVAVAVAAPQDPAASSAPGHAEKATAHEELFPLCAPPPLRALLRWGGRDASAARLAVAPRATTLAVGCVDGSVATFRRAGNGADSRDGSDVVQWRGLFELRPAQRAELSGLLTHLECEI